MLLISLAFTGVGILLVAAGAAAGWIAMVFAIGIPLSLRQMLRPGHVRIASSEFEVSQVAGHSKVYSFDRCSEFVVWQVPAAKGVQTVGFDYGYEPGSERLLTNKNKKSFGFSETIADAYALAPSELADALNAARVRELG